MKQEKRYFGRVLTTIIIIFFYLPILFMVIYSFNSSKSLTHFTGFSLRWYQAMIRNHSMMNSLYVTILVAVVATIISTIVGTLTAIGLSQSGKKMRRYINLVDDFPLMNPDIVTAIGLMLLFITFNVPKGLITLLLAHIAFCIPYVILSVMPRVHALDPNLADAAMDLGATPLRAITQVIVPEIMPGVIAGALIAFTMSFDDFIISYFVTGHGVKNLSIIVYTMSKRVNPSVNAISTVVVVLITIILLLINVVPQIVARKRAETPRYELRVRRKWPVAVGALAVVCLIVGSIYGLKGNGSQPYAGETLRIYMPGEYISNDVVDQFENETGATVVMDNFDSNEQMYIKVANGEKYDILIPSDYMIQRLREEGRLAKLDQSKIRKTLKTMNKDILNLAYDPHNRYSVPYFWGSVGISYDKRKVSLSDLNKYGFSIFLQKKYRGDIYLYDSERDSFMMALKALGYSMNTSSTKELNQAYQWLVKIVRTMKPEIVTDEIIDNMTQGRKALGLIYSGDAANVSAQNKNIGFYMPKEGTNIWTDAMVIPKNASNKKLAYVFMNYINSKKAGTENSKYIGYTSPVKAIENNLAKTTFKGIEAYTPRSSYAKDEVFKYNGKTRKVIADLWARVKVVASNAS